MANKIVQWECCRCHAQWQTQEQAEECESTHAVDLKLTATYYSLGNEFPYQIEVCDELGNIYVYKFVDYIDYDRRRRTGEE